MIPRSKDNFRQSHFITWLRARGYEILIPKVEWELVRYFHRDSSDKRGETAIVYCNKKGKLSFTGEAGYHYNQFDKGEP